MQGILRPTWAEVNLGNFKANIETVARLIPGSAGVMPVVKANAYGIGVIPAARAALTLPQVKGLAVATADEAMQLRGAGIDALVLVLGPVTPEATAVMVGNAVSFAVAGPAGLAVAQAAGKSLERKAKVHLKVETGMGRVGMAPGPELGSALAYLREAPNVETEGVFTHFSVADTDREYTVAQMEAFEAALRQMEAAGVRPKYRHAANSAAILDFPRAHLDLVRPGIMIYGSYPDESLAAKAPLKPVLSLLSRVSHVKRVSQGYSVGYGRTYLTPKPTNIVTVPAGYADGYPRLLSGCGFMLIHGKRFPIAGRVCMDQTMLDVGDEPVQVGDLVTLIGADGAATVTVDEVASISRTISHEVLTGLTARVPRIYV
ncbi:MAG: alanine racemase [Bacillota bacterium]